MEFQNLTFNLGGRVRHDTLEGRPYLVVPTVMIVEGVLSGNKGPLLYHRTELATGASVWDHKPIVINHPSDGSACDPIVLNSRKVGVILNTKWQLPKLHTEAWIDVERCTRLDRRILERLENGQKIEVSTGLYIDLEGDPGTFKGKPYNAMAANLRPDHLAVLPDSIGACSIADGAGMLQNQHSLSLNEWYEQQLKVIQGPPMFLPHFQREMEQKYGMAFGPPLPPATNELGQLVPNYFGQQSAFPHHDSIEDEEVYAPPVLNFDNPLVPKSEQNRANVEQPATVFHHFGQLNYLTHQGGAPNYFGQQGASLYRDTIEDEEVYSPPSLNFDNPLAPKPEQSDSLDDGGEEGVEYYPAPVLTFANPLKPEQE